MNSMEILDQALAAVESLHQLSNEERNALLVKAAEPAANSRYEPFKTISILMELRKIPTGSARNRRKSNN
jgi:hypothetical protein